MDDPNMHAYSDNDHPLPLPPEGHPLRALGTMLADLLDEDQWTDAEHLLLTGWDQDRVDRKTGADWRTNNSLEVWFPITAEQLAALRDLVDVMTGRMDGETVALHNALAALRRATGAA